MKIPSESQSPDITEEKIKRVTTCLTLTPDSVGNGGLNYFCEELKKWKNMQKNFETAYLAIICNKKTPTVLKYPYRNYRNQT